MIAVAVALVVAIGVALVHPPASLVFPAAAVVHTLVPSLLVPRSPRGTASRLGPVLALGASSSGFVGYVGWLASGFLVDDVRPSKLLGAALLSLTVLNAPLAFLRGGDSPFGGEKGRP